jgi:hypothetical protein
MEAFGIMGFIFGLGAWKWGYIGFIVLLAVITIFRIREAQREWHKEIGNDD